MFQCVEEALLDDVNGGAERSVVLQPVEESSQPLGERRLQLRNVTLRRPGAETKQGRWF